MAADDLIVQATLRGPAPDLFLDNTAAGYELEKSTREEYQVAYRKQEVTNPWVGGSYVVSAVPENVIEKLAVWVNAPTQAVLEARIQEILRRVRQPAYYVDWTLGNVTVRWFCQTSDYSVRTQHEYQFATTALVTVNVNRLPRTVVQ